MLYTYINTVPEPSAFITVKKQRLRQDGKSVYMKDQTEFEIELYNPTKNKVLAKIEMNGQSISNSGIILKPGQRVFLERFLDNDKKFLFETYEVNNTKEVKEAIQNNGKVTVKFHREDGTPIFRGFNTGTIYNGSSGFGWSEITYSNNIIGGTTSIVPSLDTFFTNSLDSNINASLSNRKMETGSVEEGAKSDQNFATANGTFDWFHSWITEWQIMPYSQQPKVAKDLVERCVKCNTKLKSNYKFCPECGNEASTKDITEAFLQSLTKEQLIELLKAK